MTEYRFTLDSADVIRHVSDARVAFAVANGAGELGAQVVGRVLWDFIADGETRHLYRAIFAVVRERRRSVSTPFRCDSPDCRRFMRLTILPAHKGSLDLVSELLREERRASVELFDSARPRTSDILRMCGWCKRVPTDDRWVEVEVAAERLGLFESAMPPSISHMMCPECLGAIEETIDAE